jgi:transglutaminase-like putative cysteine protease
MPGPRPFVPDLGWVAFDAANGICATDAHVRVAVGLDYLGAAPALAAAAKRSMSRCASARSAGSARAD